MSMRLADEKSSLRLTLLRRSGSWAVIELEASTPDGSWQAVDESLEGREVRLLARWLRGIGKGRRPNELGFIEPNLRFECLSNHDLARIRVWFEGEVRPPWKPWRDWSEDDCWIDLIVGHSQATDAAKELRTELEKIER